MPPRGGPQAHTQQASKRVAREIKLIREGDGITDVGPIVQAYPQPNRDDLYGWDGYIQGPPGTPYEGGHFLLYISIPTEYPMKPLEVKFITQILHPNINYKTGAICMDTLKEAWSPAMTIMSVMRSIQILLAKPEYDDPLNTEAAALNKNDPAVFKRTCEALVRERASKPYDLWAGKVQPKQKPKPS